MQSFFDLMDAHPAISIFLAGLILGYSIVIILSCFKFGSKNTDDRFEFGCTFASISFLTIFKLISQLTEMPEQFLIYFALAISSFIIGVVATQKVREKRREKRRKKKMDNLPISSDE